MRATSTLETAAITNASAAATSTGAPVARGEWLFPEMTASVESRFITGIGSLDHDGRERVLILLDIASLIASAMNGDADQGMARAA